MSEPLSSSIEQHFGDMPDPRTGPAVRHLLIDIISIAICAVICGADTWVAVEEFGKTRYAWLKRFLALPNGIPSHDTFGRVFARLDAEAFGKRFIQWVREVHTLTQGQVVAIDGKTVRRSHDQSSGKEALHLVSA